MKIPELTNDTIQAFILGIASICFVEILGTTIAAMNGNINDRKTAVELNRAETCYQEYRYNEHARVHFLFVTYCGQDLDPQTLLTEEPVEVTDD